MLSINVNGTPTNETDASVIAQAINKDTIFGATTTGAAGKGFVANTDTNTTLNAGTKDYEVLTGGGIIGGLKATLSLEVSGDAGSQLFHFDTGTTGGQMVTAINQASAATGVSASFSGTTLTLTSADYGSAANVRMQVVNEGTGGQFASSLLLGTSGVGANILATVNGVAATGQGNTVSLNTPDLAFTAALNPNQIGNGGSVDFTVNGGGALFQLGAQVNSNQQVTLGIQSVDTSSLGGTVG